jgi:hypothetical protein
MAHWELILKALAGVKEWRFTGIAGVLAATPCQKLSDSFHWDCFS